MKHDYKNPMFAKDPPVWDALRAMFGTKSGAASDTNSEGVQFTDWMDGTEAFTTKEGGKWSTKAPCTVSCGTIVHSIRMKDGRIWDRINGWRPAPKPTLATDLSFKPSTRRILAHLKKRGSITVLEALAAYGTARIAPAIHDLREGGYGIETVSKEDAGGHKYTRYYLNTAA